MPSTVENDRSRFRSLIAEFENKGVTEVTEPLLSTYLERRRDKMVVRIEEGVRREQRINVATINRELTSIKLLFRFALDKGYIDTNPAQKIKPFPTVTNHDDLIDFHGRRGLTADELDRLLGACKHSDNPILYEIVAVAVLSGLRKGELQKLTWDDVDFERNLLRVRQSKTKSVFYKPMPCELREVLLSLRDKYPHAHYVFCNPDGTAEIKAYSGHKSLKMVERYTHISPGHVQEMANTLSLDGGAIGKTPPGRFTYGYFPSAESALMKGRRVWDNVIGVPVKLRCNFTG